MIFVRTSSSRTAVVSVTNSNNPKNCRVIVTSVVIAGLIILLTVWLVTHKMFAHSPASYTYRDYQNNVLPAHRVKASDCLSEAQYAGIPSSTTMIGPFYEAVPLNQLIDVDFELPKELLDSAGRPMLLTDVINLVDIQTGSLQCKCTNHNMHLSKYLDVKLKERQIQVIASVKYSNLSISELRNSELCESEPEIVAKYRNLLLVDEPDRDLCVFSNILLATLGPQSTNLLIRIDVPVLAVAPSCNVEVHRVSNVNSAQRGKTGVGGSTVSMVVQIKSNETARVISPFRADLNVILMPSAQNGTPTSVQLSQPISPPLDNALGACLDAEQVSEEKAAGYATATFLVKIYLNNSVGFCSKKLYVDAVRSPSCQRTLASWYTGSLTPATPVTASGFRSASILAAKVFRSASAPKSSAASQDAGKRTPETFRSASPSAASSNAPESSAASEDAGKRGPQAFRSASPSAAASQDAGNRGGDTRQWEACDCLGSVLLGVLASSLVATLVVLVVYYFHWQHGRLRTAEREKLLLSLRRRLERSCSLLERVFSCTVCGRAGAGDCLVVLPCCKRTEICGACLDRCVGLSGQCPLCRSSLCRHDVIFLSNFSELVSTLRDSKNKQPCVNA